MTYKFCESSFTLFSGLTASESRFWVKCSTGMIGEGEVGPHKDVDNFNTRFPSVL